MRIAKSKRSRKMVLDPFNLGVICGGPSLERGISLNSARSVLDHLGSEQIAIRPIYVDFFKNFYVISKAQMYSNTPSDFDFKLAKMGEQLSTREVVDKLKTVDLVFPVIHGTYGEDGQLQQFLEAYAIPFIGCSSAACSKMFNKNRAAQILHDNGFATIPSSLLKIGAADNKSIIEIFFAEHKLKRAIIKPIAGGSSIGVFSVTNVAQALEKLQCITEMQLFKQVIIEPFCIGREFTVIVLENPKSVPIALIPTEIQVSYAQGQIFDYRRKYLPTANTTWHCPPRFDDEVIATIRTQASQIFKLFKMRDFARLDGWILNDGQIIFSDLNPISGMEQNSFIFQQASRLGMTHRDLFWYVLQNACRRYNLDMPRMPQQTKSKKPVHVLFGGKTSERQVSLMSGTNVWLKLRQSKNYEPVPYFLDKQGEVWYIPYTYALNHTVEEIYENCLTANKAADRLENFVREIRTQLGLNNVQYCVKDNLPFNMSFNEFLKHTKKHNTFLFLGLHGGEGEDGTIQQILDQNQILYNGSKHQASALCMDKFLTGKVVDQIKAAAIAAIPKRAIKISDFAKFNHSDYQKFWQELIKDLSSDTFVIKPRNSGCSSGVAHLIDANDLEKYITLVKNKVPLIAPYTLSNQSNIVEMELENNENFIIETQIETDKLQIKNNEIIYQKNSGWIELTVGVLEAGGNYHALNPSITVAEGEVLTLEEKFQGGTGINITPPPEFIITKAVCSKIKTGIEKTAKALGIKNYARIDVFFNVDSMQLYVIEANTLPALTPSTVIYHQALAECTALYPLAFLEKIISLCGY